MGYDGHDLLRAPTKHHQYGNSNQSFFPCTFSWRGKLSCFIPSVYRYNWLFPRYLTKKKKEKKRRKAFFLSLIGRGLATEVARSCWRGNTLEELSRCHCGCGKWNFNYSWVGCNWACSHFKSSLETFDSLSSTLESKPLSCCYPVFPLLHRIKNKYKKK